MDYLNCCTRCKYKTHADLHGMSAFEIIKLNPDDVSICILDRPGGKPLMGLELKALQRLVAMKNEEKGLSLDMKMKGRKRNIENFSSVYNPRFATKDLSEDEELELLLMESRLANLKKNQGGGKKRQTKRRCKKKSKSCKRRRCISKRRG